MKKRLAHTKCTVKLRKALKREEWYLVIESYPVFVNGSTTPKREVESLNRMVKTPIWDKKHNARTSADGSVTYKPKRDVNGIIQCRSALDQEACIFADKVRAIRQHEFDNAALFSNDEANRVAQMERSQCNFIDYFDKVTYDRHKNSSSGIIVNWERVHKLLKMFTGGSPLLFADISLKTIEGFKNFLLTAPQGGSKKGTISQNTASTYFSIFKAALHQAFIDGYLTIDIAAKVKGIAERESRREHLTMKELNRLAATPCDNPVIKRASLFSALTGLRHVDIKQMKWKEITHEGEHYRVNFTQQKTKGVEYTPISEQAYKFCGERRGDDQLVFEGLPDPSWLSKPLARWIKAAGITKHITFHCFRHTFATLQLANGTDIYTVSKMLGHTNVRTTQIYTKVVDEKKEEAADAIKLSMDSIG